MSILLVFYLFQLQKNDSIPFTFHYPIVQCSIKGASYKGVKHHPRMKQNINWMDKVIAMLMNANLQRLSVQMIQNPKASWEKRRKENFPFAFDYWKIMIIFPTSRTLRSILQNNSSKTFCKHNLLFPNITIMKWIHGIQC